MFFLNRLKVQNKDSNGSNNNRSEAERNQRKKYHNKQQEDRRSSHEAKGDSENSNTPSQRSNSQFQKGGNQRRGNNTRFNSNNNRQQQHRPQQYQQKQQQQQNQPHRHHAAAADDDDDFLEDDVKLSADEEKLIEEQAMQMEEDDGEFGNYDDDDDEEENFGANTLSPIVQAMLQDHEFFERDLLAGKASIDTSDMDPVDAFFTEAFLEGLKTESGTYRTMVFGNRDKRFQVPKPRSLVQLLAASTPNIKAPRDSTGYSLALAAWPAIERNQFYNQYEKSKLVNRIAAFSKEFEAFCETVPDEELDDVLGDEFRRGWELMEQEEQQEQEVITIDSIDHGDTDWNVEAVVDEDQL